MVLLFKLYSKWSLKHFLIQTKLLFCLYLFLYAKNFDDESSKMASLGRDGRGRFASRREKIKSASSRRKKLVYKDHDYCQNVKDTEIRTSVEDLGNKQWRTGRRLVEFGVLLDNLASCKNCGLGPVPLTHLNIVGELVKGVSGYLYVQCMNNDCRFVNRVAYGKTHRSKEKGMPSFVANTKLGVGK